ncbi:hypothetical protein [Phormidesmis sp. 146-33]
MLKRVMLTALVTIVLSNPVIAAPQWESQGVASTGEKVYLNLDSIQIDRRSVGFRATPGYFFTYQIGKDRPTAFTTCDGRFQVEANGVFKPLMKPQSEATRKMLERVCHYQRKRAYVFAPPSNVRTGPNGKILCSIKTQATIITYGSIPYGEEAGWFYTDVCGKIGVIHTSQIRF